MNAIDIQPIFSHCPVDRLAHLRGDIFSQRNPMTDKHLLISQGSVLVNNSGGCFFTSSELPDNLLNESLAIFLGGDQAGHYFAQSTAPEIAENYQTVPLREFFIEGEVSDQQFSLLAEANSMLSWHRSHRFCARCGSKTAVAEGGWRRDCPDCEAQHFPRTDPVAIMLVTKGDKCLLGRSPHFSEKLFSCLAGFMEPGETIEQAALRELHEEAGVEGENIRYLSNQPWPFPSSLMIGLHIEAKNTQLNIDYNELEQAIWVSKEDIKAVLDGDTDKPFLLPPKIAIARNLLEYWVNC